MRDHTSTTLRFAGDWPWWAGMTGALVFGAIAWLLYRRDIGHMASWVRWSLPALRASAVAMVVLMLSGPVLHHRQVIGELSRLLLFVDGSRSMDLSDGSMDPGRKVRILQQLGLLRGDAARMDLPNAADALTDAQSLIAELDDSKEADTSEWNRLLTEIAEKLGGARDALSKSGKINADRLSSFSREAADPARDIAGREMRQIDDRQRAVRDLGKVSEVLERWKSEIGDAFEKALAEGGAEESAMKAALAKFDTLPRWQRLQSMLLDGGEQSLLAKLAETHDVQLLLLEGGKASKLWQPTARDSTVLTGLPKPDYAITDLATGVKTFLGSGTEKEQQGAVVLLSDGQHNEGESPIEVARVLGARQMPVYSVGFGASNRPRDLALMRLEAPVSAFIEDRVRGHVAINDHMPAGQTFSVMIRDEAEVVWEQKLVTDGKGLRNVPFDFPLAELAKKRLKTQRAGTTVTGVPVELGVSISQIAGESELGNNDAPLRLRAVTQRRKILLLDGRPRWETRYLRNLFERDEQWDITSVIAGVSGGEAGLKRGQGPENFPTDAETLNGYDLIIFGDLHRSALKENELEWIRDFVAQRGGAIVFIDGARGALKEYGNTPLGPVFPIEWKENPVRNEVSRLVLSGRATDLAAFSLAPERAQNVEAWQGLQTPRWLSGATPLPGAEVLVEAEVTGGANPRVPAVVYRPFGAGRAFYHAFEDSWRWRYEVADKHHVKYWNQVANWVAELPFAVHDKFVSLDAGAITYRPGESADIRVRLRNGEGKPVADAVVDAVLYRDGQRMASIRLAPEDNAGGLFRGRTAALPPGEYEVGVESPAITERDTRARTEFKVETLGSAELAQLNTNEPLLRQIADAGGGQYLREEQLPRLLEMLAPMSQGRVIESDTVLWQSYWWFLPLIGLLTIEWILRKRVGLL